MTSIHINWVNSQISEKNWKKASDNNVEKGPETEIKACEDNVKEVMATLLLQKADKFCYGGLKSALAQHISMGTNQYPHSVKETMNILNT